MILFPSGKDPELLTFLFGLPAGNEMRGAGLLGLHSPNLMYPEAYGHSRRELTPVRLCFVRLSWRQRARPSTTLHEIQICRSRLEYLLCNTHLTPPQVARRMPFHAAIYPGSYPGPFPGSYPVLPLRRRQDQIRYAESHQGNPS